MLEQQLERREQEAEAKKEKEKKEKTGSSSTPIKQGTNWLLRGAWFNLIPTFGLSLLYIDLHIFLHAVLGDRLFSKLGDEWKSAAIPSGAISVGNSSRLVETMAVLLLNFFIFSVWFFFLTILVLVGGWLAAGFWDAAKMLLSGGWETIKIIYNLFIGIF